MIRAIFWKSLFQPDLQKSEVMARILNYDILSRSLNNHSSSSRSAAPNLQLAYRRVNMKLFHVDASAKRETSNSRALARFFIENLRAQRIEVEVDYLDVTVDTPAHVSQDFAVATYRAESERTPEMKATLAASDALCKRLLEADAFLFAMPMYNWSMPSAFKAFIDNITRAGITYKHTEGGRYVGQLSRQKTLFITTRGADLRPGSPFSSMDALTPALCRRAAATVLRSASAGRRIGAGEGRTRRCGR
jgi:FMN-dependent NADH-azoreductase